MKQDGADTQGLARLLDGLTALDAGRLGVAKYRFDQIITACGTKPALEAGHAWRGLAEISIRQGDISGAEDQLRRSVSAYREIARVDPTARSRAGEGEGAALLLGAELMLRRGLSDPGAAALRRAAEVLARLGDDRSAEAWATTGRLAVHARRPNQARRAFDEALSRYEKAGNVSGHAEVMVEAASLARDAGDIAGATRMLGIASRMAKNAGRLSVAARAELGLAQMASQAGGAKEHWDKALSWATQSGDIVICGFALLGLGATGWRGGMQPLLAGSQLLLDSGHFPGLGLGLLRIGDQALRDEDPDVALVACEGAWRVYRGFGTADGLSRVLRLAVKAFAAKRAARATLLAAFARADLVGDADPHTVEVRDHYASLAPRSLTVQLGMMPRRELVTETRRALQRRIVPALRDHGLLAQSFATAQGALDVLGVMVGASPRGALKALVPEADLGVPRDLPEPELPDGESFDFTRRTTVRLSLATPTTMSTVSDRSPVYDPDGRLAAVASSSLVFVDDGPTVTEDTAGEPTRESDAVSTDEAFPEDAAGSDWLRLGAEGIDWADGERPAPESFGDRDDVEVSLDFEDGGGGALSDLAAALAGIEGLLEETTDPSLGRDGPDEEAPTYVEDDRTEPG